MNAKQFFLGIAIVGIPMLAFLAVHFMSVKVIGIPWGTGVVVVTTVALIFMLLIFYNLAFQRQKAR